MDVLIEMIGYYNSTVGKIFHSLEKALKEKSKTFDEDEKAFSARIIFNTEDESFSINGEDPKKAPFLRITVLRYIGCYSIISALYEGHIKEDVLFVNHKGRLYFVSGKVISSGEWKGQNLFG